MTSASFPSGTIIDEKYRVERELGIGGMGTVVLALHLGLEEQVAIKMLLPDALRDAEAVARFAREAKAAARIKSEHVARVLDVSSLDDGSPYIVMEYLEGSDLEQVVEARGPLSIEDAVDYVLQACEALAEAHARGIVHRDLKPGNLHLSRRADGSPLVKVLDFGISKISTRENDGSVTTTSALLGSPLYMSPEQMKATRDVDSRSDIWAMGVVLYELVTGRSPFAAPSMPQVCARVLDTEPDPIVEGAVPEGLRAAILRCLAKKPENRYQDVAGLAEALAAFAPERSKISIERIAKVIDSPVTSDTSRRLKMTSRSAPTMDEVELQRRPAVTMPLPRLGTETMANATISAAMIPKRSRRTTAAYALGGFAGVLGVLWMAHGHGVANAKPESLTAAATNAVAAPQVSADVAGTEAAPGPRLVVARSDGSPRAPAASASSKDDATPAPTAAPQTTAADHPPPLPTMAAVRSHKKAQEMSKYFGGRD